MEREWRLPPLILHPFAPEKGPDRLIEGTQAQLVLDGLVSRDGADPEKLRQLVLDGRYQEVRMLYFLGKDVVRWMEQCADFAVREPLLRDAGIREQSFAALLVDTPPSGLTEKLTAWGVSDRRGIFSRAIGLNALFSAPPSVETVTSLFLNSYHRFADYLFVCFQNLVPFAPLSPEKFLFEIFASEDYARKLAEGWE